MSGKKGGANAALAEMDRVLEFTSRKHTTMGAVSELALIVMITAVLFAAIVSIFFFTVVSSVENQVVQNNTKRIVTGLVDDFTLALDPAQRQIVKEALTGHLAPPDMSDEDKRVAEQNAVLTKNALTALGIGAGILLFLAIVLYGVARHVALGSKTLRGRMPGIGYPSLSFVIGTTLLTAVAVVFTETFFLFAVARNYRSIDPNVIRKTILQNMVDFANS